MGPIVRISDSIKREEQDLPLSFFLIMSSSNMKDKEPQSLMLCHPKSTKGCRVKNAVSQMYLPESFGRWWRMWCQNFYKKEPYSSKRPNRAISIVGGLNWSFSSGHGKKKEIPIKGGPPCPMWWQSAKSTPVDLRPATSPGEQPQSNILILTGWALLIPWESGSSIMGDVSHGEDLAFSLGSLWSWKTRHLN